MTQLRKFLLKVNPLVFVVMILTPLLAFADLPAVPDSDPLAALLDLVVNWKSMGPLAIGMVGVTVATQLIKKFWPNWKAYRLVVTILASAYGVLLGLSQGIGILPTLASVLVTGGGAVAIYEAFKGMKNAVAPPQQGMKNAVAPPQQ